MFFLLASQLANAASSNVGMRVKNNCDVTLYFAPFVEGKEYEAISVSPGTERGIVTSYNNEYMFISAYQAEVDNKNLTTVSPNAVQDQLQYNGGHYSLEVLATGDYDSYGAYIVGEPYITPHQGTDYYVLPVSCPQAPPQITTVTFAWNDIEANSPQGLSSTADLLASMLSHKYSGYKLMDTKIIKNSNAATYNIALKYYDTNQS